MKYANYENMESWNLVFCVQLVEIWGNICQQLCQNGDLASFSYEGLHSILNMVICLTPRLGGVREER
jgi:hypothetical protein